MKKQSMAPDTCDEQTFRAWVDENFHDESIFVLANRGPAASERQAAERRTVRDGSSGLVTALRPLIGSCRILWVARGDLETPSAGIVHGHEEVPVPPASSRLRLRRVAVPQHVEQGHYHGFCNEGLWPLCHRTSVRPTFRDHDFRMYSCANAEWVAAFCEEVTSDSPVVLVQDYHLALAPKMIRARFPEAALVTFWHVPFPTPGVLSVCPWEKDLIEGLLGSSIVGFQTDEDRKNFLDAAVCILGAHVDRDEHIVSYDDRRTHVRVYPASVEWPSPSALRSPSVEVCRAIVGRRFGLSPDTRVIVGIDRLDYTKGLIPKLLAFERLLITQPHCRGKVVLLQVAEPSRSGLSAYQDYRTHLYRTADRITQRFKTRGYEPIVMLERRMDQTDVFELLRAADVCYVGSLHDGMNLVAKEFVSARDDERGVLLLSEFAGAARELTEAVLINPYMSDDCARTLAEALKMPPAEQARRMQALRSVVKCGNSFGWARDILADAVAARSQLRASLRPHRRVSRAAMPALT